MRPCFWCLTDDGLHLPIRATRDSDLGPSASFLEDLTGPLTVTTRPAVLRRHFGLLLMSATGDPVKAAEEGRENLVEMGLAEYGEVTVRVALVDALRLTSRILKESNRVEISNRFRLLRLMSQTHACREVHRLKVGWVNFIPLGPLRAQIADRV